MCSHRPSPTPPILVHFNQWIAHSIMQNESMQMLSSKGLYWLVVRSSIQSTVVGVVSSFNTCRFCSRVQAALSASSCEEAMQLTSAAQIRKLTSYWHYRFTEFGLRLPTGSGYTLYRNLHYQSRKAAMAPHDMPS